MKRLLTILAVLGIFVGMVAPAEAAGSKPTAPAITHSRVSGMGNNTDSMIVSLNSSVLSGVVVPNILGDNTARDIKIPIDLFSCTLPANGVDNVVVDFSTRVGRALAGRETEIGFVCINTGAAPQDYAYFASKVPSGITCFSPETTPFGVGSEMPGCKTTLGVLNLSLTSLIELFWPEPTPSDPFPVWHARVIESTGVTHELGTINQSGVLWTPKVTVEENWSPILNPGGDPGYPIYVVPEGGQICTNPSDVQTCIFWPSINDVDPTTWTGNQAFSKTNVANVFPCPSPYVFSQPSVTNPRQWVVKNPPPLGPGFCVNVSMW